MEGEELWLDFYLYTIVPDTQEVLVGYLPFPFRYLPVMLHGIARATLNKDGRLARLSNGTAFFRISNTPWSQTAIPTAQAGPV